MRNPVHIVEAAIRVGFLMGFAMISTIIWTAPMMVEIAAIRIILLMSIVMISTTIWPAPMMVEIAVDLMSIHNTAQNVNVLNEGKTRIQYHNNIV